MRIAILIMILMSCAYAYADQKIEIDRKFTAIGDITGDGISEILTLHVLGSSPQQPFKWRFTVSDLNGFTIYHDDRDDTEIDKFFYDKGYMMDCDDYSDCKDKYYFYYLPKTIFSSLQPTGENFEFNKNMHKNLYATASQFLKQKKISDKNKSVAINEMKKLLKSGRFHTLNIPISPVQSSIPMVWVPHVKLFVPYYQE